MDDVEQLLTVKGLADYLDIPVATIYAWRYRREGPPGFRVGRYLRFRRSDVEQWIDQQPSRGERTWGGPENRQGEWIKSTGG